MKYLSKRNRVPSGSHKPARADPRVGERERAERMQDPKRSDESRGTPSSPCPWCAARGRVISINTAPCTCTLEIDGGAPDKNSEFRRLITSAFRRVNFRHAVPPSSAAHLACCPNVIAGRRDSLFHARALPLMLTHVHRPPFCFVQPGVLGIGSTVRPYDLRTLLAAGVCAARRAPSTHAMFGGSTCPAP